MLESTALGNVPWRGAFFGAREGWYLVGVLCEVCGRRGSDIALPGRWSIERWKLGDLQDSVPRTPEQVPRRWFHLEDSQRRGRLLSHDVSHLAWPNCPRCPASMAVLPSKQLIRLETGRSSCGQPGQQGVGRQFVPQRADHCYCSRACREQGGKRTRRAAQKSLATTACALPTPHVGVRDVAVDAQEVFTSGGERPAWKLMRCGPRRRPTTLGKPGERVSHISHSRHRVARHKSMNNVSRIHTSAIRPPHSIGQSRSR